MVRTIINIFFQIIVLLVFFDVIVSYFLSPYHPVRSVLDQIVHPLLAPIRSILPKQMMFDLSPIIFVVILEIIQGILLRIL